MRPERNGLAPTTTSEVEVRTRKRKWAAGLSALGGFLATMLALFGDGSSVLSVLGLARSTPDHPMTVEARELLVNELREALRDGELGAEEKARIEAKARSQSVSSAALEDLLTLQEPRLREASRHLNAGVKLVQGANYEPARREFLAATLRDPGDAMAWTNLAEVDRLTGRLRNAEEASERALAQMPASWLVQYNHALLLAQLDRPGPAYDHLEKAVLLADESARPALLADVKTNPALSGLRRQGRLEPLFAREEMR